MAELATIPMAPIYANVPLALLASIANKWLILVLRCHAAREEHVLATRTHFNVFVCVALVGSFVRTDLLAQKSALKTQNALAASVVNQIQAEDSAKFYK